MTLNISYWHFFQLSAFEFFQDFCHRTLGAAKNFNTSRAFIIMVSVSKGL
jgi:hypothetical protein